MTNTSTAYSQNQFNKQLGLARANSGFTLIEIMVVMIIIGLLATLILPNVLGQADKARVVAAQAGLETINKSLALYNLDNFSYPNSSENLEALITQPSGKQNWRGPYISRKSITDPWGNLYIYTFPGSNNPNSYDLQSYGADGVVGGEGIGKDIVNWDTQ